MIQTSNPNLFGFNYGSIGPKIRTKSLDKIHARSFLEDKIMYNEEGGRTILTGRYDGRWVSQPARHLTNFKSHFRTTERFMALFWHPIFFNSKLLLTANFLSPINYLFSCHHSKKSYKCDIQTHRHCTLYI